MRADHSSLSDDALYSPRQTKQNKKTKQKKEKRGLEIIKLHLDPSLVLNVSEGTLKVFHEIPPPLNKKRAVTADY